MKAIEWTLRRALATCTSIAVLAGCAGRDGGSAYVPAAATISVPQAKHAETTGRCSPFAANFDEFVGCQRADGTLRTFNDRQISWRARYFVRYATMPCGEMPTEQEAYVFHAVIDDLNADPDLTGSGRAAIRAAMYEGTPDCK